MGRAGFSIEPVLMGRDVAEQVLGMGRKAGLAPSGFNRAKAQALRFVEPTEQQTGAAHRPVSPAVMLADSARRLTLKKLLGLSNPAQRLAGLAALRQRPARQGNRPRWNHDEMRSPRRIYPGFYQ